KASRTGKLLVPGLATSLRQIFGGSVLAGEQESALCKRVCFVAARLLLYRAGRRWRSSNSRRLASHSVDSRQGSPEMRQPTRMRQSKAVSRGCLQREAVLGFRHQWKTRSEERRVGKECRSRGATYH